jgi:phosphatidylethanolamine/phosphatidyl-N-methylethanolamine N-methyltransferase
VRNEAAVWNRFSGIYDVFIKRYTSVYRQIIAKTSALIAPESNVLEVATGTGILALGIAGSADRIEAVDISQDMIAHARKKARRNGITNVLFSVQDAYALTYGAGTFDLVLISNALHIMPYPERALAEIRRVLKPDGLLVAPTFVHAGSRRAVLFSHLVSVTGFRTYHQWTQQTYTRFLGENGFDIVDIEHMRASFPVVYCCCKVTQNGRNNPYV